MILRSQSRAGPWGEVEELRYFDLLHQNTLFHRLGGAIKRGCVEIFSFIFPPYYMTSENINIFTGYVVGRKNIDIFTGVVANAP